MLPSVWFQSVIPTVNPMWCESSIIHTQKNNLSWSFGWGSARPHWWPLSSPHWTWRASARRAWWASRWASRWRGSCRSSVAGPPADYCRWPPGARWGCSDPSCHIHMGTGTSCIWEEHKHKLKRKQIFKEKGVFHTFSDQFPHREEHQSAGENRKQESCYRDLFLLEFQTHIRISWSLLFWFWPFVLTICLSQVPKDCGSTNTSWVLAADHWLQWNIPALDHTRHWAMDNNIKWYSKRYFKSLILVRRDLWCRSLGVKSALQSELTTGNDFKHRGYLEKLNGCWHLIAGSSACLKAEQKDYGYGESWLPKDIETQLSCVIDLYSGKVAVIKTQIN